MRMPAIRTGSRPGRMPWPLPRSPMPAAGAALRKARCSSMPHGFRRLAADPHRPGRQPHLLSLICRSRSAHTGTGSCASAAALRPSPDLDPDRCVVAGFFPAAIGLVDAAGDQPVGKFGRKQRVVDAEAVIALPGTGLIIPDRSRYRRADCAVRSASRPAVMRAGGHRHRAIRAASARRRPWRGGDQTSWSCGMTLKSPMTIAGTSSRGNFAHAAAQPFHPAQFVIELRARLGIAVGQIDAGHAQAEDIGFDIAGMFVLRLARRARAALRRRLRHRRGWQRR